MYSLMFILSQDFEPQMNTWNWKVHANDIMESN